MNKGDATYILLDIKIDDEPIIEGTADDIELSFNLHQLPYAVRKSLKNGDIVWDANYQQYKVYLSQQDTFKMRDGENTWQLRVLIGDEVLSTNLDIIEIGPVNSAKVL